MYIWAFDNDDPGKDFAQAAGLQGVERFVHAQVQAKRCPESVGGRGHSKTCFVAAPILPY